MHLSQSERDQKLKQLQESEGFDSVEAMLKSFSQDDRDHMIENGKISVTCEFCSATYDFAPTEVGAKEN